MGSFKIAAVPLALIFAAMGTVTATASQYVVKPGDSVWAIAHAHHLTATSLAAQNHLSNPNRIYPGQRLTLPDPPAAAAPAHAAKPAGVHGAAARAIIVAAARRHDLNPNFALAVSYWESGWNQDAVSSTGAIGLMQIEPYTGRSAGPNLLHRSVDLNNPADNAELGVTLLRHYLDVFNGDPKLALAAYYQGETATRKHGVYPSSQRYVDGIWALRNRFQAAGGVPGA